MVSAVLLISTTCLDAQPAEPYVGLYADAGHSVMSVYNTGGFMPFELWIWWLPSQHGLITMEFKLTYPSNVIAILVTRNPDLMIVLDECIGYLCPMFQTCHIDWVWSHHQTCYLTSAVPGFVEIGPSPYASAVLAANCELGYPIEEVIVLNNLALNQEGAIAVELQSWGAIRNLYR